MLMGYSKGSASGPAPSSMCGWSGWVVGEVVWARWRAAACATRGGVAVHTLVSLAAVWPFAWTAHTHVRPLM